MIFHSFIVTAFDKNTIGTKVTNKEHFLAILGEKLQTYAFPEDGHGFVSLDECLEDVTSGVADRDGMLRHMYHCREYRGEMCMFADRVAAYPAEHLNVIIYTLKAYLADPQVSHAERGRLSQYIIENTCGEPIYILVAVLATAGPVSPPLSSHRFVHNLAGGNLTYTPQMGYTLEKAISEAQAIVEYEKHWITVADRLD
jgi:hypothetical protein